GPGIDRAAGGEEDRPDDLHRIGRVVALLRSHGVVAEEIDRLPTLEVDDPERVAGRDDPAPVAARRHDDVVQHQRRTFPRNAAVRPWAGRVKIASGGAISTTMPSSSMTTRSPTSRAKRISWVTTSIGPPSAAGLLPACRSAP